MTAPGEVLAAAWERLLAPISPEHPAGESLRYEGTYDAIQAARKEDDPNLPQGVWVTPLKTANWGEVKERAIQALGERSKDLQIAAWLGESMLVLHGLPGLTQTMDLIAELCDRHWPDLHPLLDDGDPDQRVALLDWLDSKAAERMRGLSISRPAAPDAAGYTLLDWERMSRLERLHKTHRIDDQELAAEGQPGRSEIETAWAATPRSFFQRARRDLAALEAALARLETVLAPHLGDQAPRFRHVREVAASLEHLLRRSGGDARPAADAADAAVGPPAEDADATETAEAEATAVDEDEPAGGGAPGRSAPIHSRAEAYRRLEEVADYLLRTEPHSPAGYLVRRAAAWGEMSLGEVLQDIVREPGGLQGIYALLGLDEPKEGGP